MDRQRQIPEQHRQLNKACLNCPRCNSTNTKFCYYNNYSLSQPRHFCKACKRYWTRGGTLRNVPVGGGCRKNNNNKQRVNKRPTSSSSSSPNNNPQPSSANQASQIVTGPNNNCTQLLAPLFYGLAGHVNNNSGYEQGLIQQKQGSYDSDVNSTKEMILTDPFLSDYYNNNINPISLFLPPPSSFLVQGKQGAGDAVVQDTSNQQGHQLIQGLIPFQQQQKQKQEDQPQEQRWDSKQISSDLLGHTSSSVYWTGERNVVSSWPPT